MIGRLQDVPASRIGMGVVIAFLVGAGAGVPGARAATTEGAGLAPFVADYFEQYCYRCHGDETQKGDRRLDQFPTNVGGDEDALLLLEEALDALNLGDMPPEKKDVTQPPAEKTRAIIEWATAYLQRVEGVKTPSSTVMRRLNRFEYVNTLRDLLGVDTEAFNPTGDFPADATEHGFDNIGEALVLSDYQLKRYLETAEAFLGQALYFDRAQPEPKAWRYTAKDFNGVYGYERAPVTWRLIVDDEYMEIGHGQPSERHVNYVKKFTDQGGAPEDGWYDIRVRAAAANRLDHGYEHPGFETYQTQPLKMALWIAPEPRLLDKNAADGRRLVATYDLPDEAPDFFTARVWLVQGSTPFVSWTNGISSKGNIRRVAEKYHPEVIRATNTELDAAGLGDPEAKALVALLKKNDDNKLLSQVYHGPVVRVYGMDIQGPIVEDWPPASHQMLFGDQTDAGKIDIEQAVYAFATRAFRRPVETDDVQHYCDFIRQRVRSGDTPARAIKLGLAAILTSPRFLYLDEGNEEVETQLAPHELASRLSYFLWGSMPDVKLTSAAASGRLVDSDGLQTQADRLIRDAKAYAFVEHFTDSWLRINTLGSMPPDVKGFSTYYHQRLESAMKEETRLFFANLLETNGPILDLLDSDYTFVNDALAAHYGIGGVKGEHFRKVALRPEHHRGGLLGQGSVLTLTANGIETSPVVRGVWVLENILGTPPSPPPPDVEPLEPDTRGSTTIRQQLDKHRNVPACADCHAKIDPLGFALEFYDPIGAYRTNYPAHRGTGPFVDGAGQLPSGESFQDEHDLKALLLDRKDQFAKALTEKLLTYATGRPMTFRDRDAVDAIAEQVAAQGYGLRDLVLAVVNSGPFARR